jgi:hypothetical protein
MDSILNSDNENSSIFDYESFLLELNRNFTLSVHINGPLLGSFLLIVVIIALSANLFVLIVTQKDRNLRFQPSSIFLNSLIIGNLVMTFVDHPFAIIAGCSGHWMFGSSVVERCGVCQFVGFVRHFFVLIVVSTLSLISFDRWLFIIKPMIYKRYMKLPLALGIVIGLWIVCALLNIPPCFGLGKIHFIIFLASCSPDSSNELPFLFVSYMLVVFGALIAIIVATSIWTCCFTKSFLARSEATSQNHHLYSSKKRRVCGIFSALILACGICFITPLIVFTINDLIHQLPDVVLTIVVVILYLFIIINPLIQSYFRPDVKNFIISICNYLIKKLNIHSLCKSDKETHTTMTQ